MNDEEYLKELQQLRNLSDSTLNRYKIDLKHYTKYTGMSLEELLEEADDEEEQRIRMRKRKIKTHMLGLQQQLLTYNFEPSTIKTIFSRIKAFYRTYDIEIPQIRTVGKESTETLEDIPTLEHIRVASSTNNLKHKALILFMASSGTGSKETLSITIQDFIDASSDYHHETSIQNVLDVLSNKKNIIPTFHLRRFKTNHNYYTFCSPEASEAIIRYLKTRENLKPESKLFDITGKGLVMVFQRINEKYKWGWKKTRRFFHAHSLRMFFATQLTKAGLDYLIIQWLSGRAVPATTATYFKPSPEKLKKEYMKVVDKVSISKVDVYDVKSEEFAQLEETNKSLKGEMEAMKEEQRKRDKQMLLEISNLKKQQKQDHK